MLRCICLFGGRKTKKFFKKFCNYLVTYKIKKKYVFFYHEITHYYRGITKVTAGGAWQVVCSGKEGE
jgi:hypothetical protein